MTVALPAEPLSLQASAAWSWLMETAAAVAKAVSGRQVLSPIEAQLYAVAEELGAQVLDAQDVADLHARVYAIASDPRFLAWEATVTREVDRSELPTPGDVERAFVTALGPTHLARECARLLAARIDVVAQIHASLGEADPREDVSKELDAILADFRCPPVLRSLFEETVAGEVALLAMLAPMMDAERWPCPPWLRLALLEQVRLASVSHLRLLSIVPQVIIPDDVLPQDERLVPRELDRESRERARHVLPSRLPVGKAYVARLREMVDGDSPAPAGVRALFTD